MKKKVLIRTITICHILIVALGASHVFDYSNGNNFLAKPLMIYNDLSFAGSTFQFFANVGIDTKISFLTENDKEELNPAYFKLNNAQTEYRLIGMKAFFHQDTLVQDLLALSWGVNILNNNIEAQKVHIAVDLCDFPTMEEYKCGRIPKWDPLYYTLIEVN